MKIFYFSLLALALIAIINHSNTIIPSTSSLTIDTNQNYPSFAEWRLKFGKHYPSESQLVYREAIYLKNFAKVEAHNILFQLGQTSYQLGLNLFADLTPQEFVAKFQRPLRIASTNKCDGSIMDTPNPPTELDWANKVNPVESQGSCGKAWAMIAANAVQSLYAIKVGSLPKLSTQQLLQCSVDYGNQGCDGGFMDQAFWYIIDNGIAQSSSYPERDPSKCKYVMNMKYTGISRCARVPSRSYSKLLSAIVQQPVSVAVDLNSDMALYKKGIYTGKCTSNINHGMLLVGYGGKQADGYYWRLKNTLSTSWGDNGFISLKRVESDGDGQCGIQIWPSVPQNIL